MLFIFLIPDRYSNELNDWAKNASKKKGKSTKSSVSSTPLITKKATAFSLFYNNGWVHMPSRISAVALVG